MASRPSAHRGRATWPQVLELASGALGADRAGHRAGFLELARAAQAPADGEAASR